MAEVDGLSGQPHQVVLSEDIFGKILSCLEVKDLVRFRCACKSWRAIISSSQFVNKHCSQAVNTNNALRFLFLRDSPPPYDTSVSWRIVDYQAVMNSIHGNISSREFDEYPDILNDSDYMGSCNGLVGLLHGSGMEEWGIYRVILWNPSTRETRKLPDLDYFQYFPYFYGFGYDSTTQDYKVLLGLHTKISTQIAIFALKMGSWRIVEDVPYHISGEGYLFKGALHWLYAWQNRIMYFDFAYEKLHFFFTSKQQQREHESDENYPYWVATMGSIGNYLCYCSGGRRTGDKVKVWAMMEYGDDESWTKLLVIPTDNLPECVNTVYLLEDGHVFMCCGHTLVLYNPKDGTCRPVPEFPVVYHAGVAYVETLVSPITSS